MPLTRAGQRPISLSILSLLSLLSLSPSSRSRPSSARTVLTRAFAGGEPACGRAFRRGWVRDRGGGRGWRRAGGGVPAVALAVNKPGGVGDPEPHTPGRGRGRAVGDTNADADAGREHTDGGGGAAAERGVVGDGDSRGRVSSPPVVLLSPGVRDAVLTEELCSPTSSLATASSLS
eukprot:1568195-Rhodomonas_salina.1